MKKTIILALACALIGCGGGYDDMDAARPGGGIGNNVTKPDEPSTPSDDTRWTYASFADANGIFSLRANNYALNYFYDPQFTTIKRSPWVQLARRKSSSGAVTDTLTIFINSTVSCTPSCAVAMTFNGQRATYQMRHSSDGVIVPINEFTENQLFNKFTSSNIAIISLPIIGLSEPFNARYDLSGYDIKQMTF